jgi:hypothetical protein
MGGSETCVSVCARCKGLGIDLLVGEPREALSDSQTQTYADGASQEHRRASDIVLGCYFD